MVLIGLAVLFLIKLIKRRQNMISEGFEWRQMTLGMVTMIASMIWQKNKRRVYLVVLALVGLYVAKRVSNRARLSLARAKRRQLRDRMMSRLEREEVSTAEKEAIVKKPFNDLLRCLKKKKVTAGAVMDAYWMKAVEAHKKTNAVVEMIEESKEQAMELDKYGDPNGLLYGIPVSLKENYEVKDKKTSLGCAKLTGKPSKDDAALVKMLKQHGAIPFVRTNLPQTVLSSETDNPIYGATLHPLDNTRGPGGSSGGEAALIASGASILGFGTDIAGSIRIPAHICGISALKPALGRLSTDGTVTLTPGQTCVGSVNGPMARDVDTLVAAMTALLDKKSCDFDYRQPYIPFNTEVYNCKKDLKIGYYEYDGAFVAADACTRAVSVGVDILQKQGHTLVPWDFSRYGLRGFALWIRVFSADGGETMKRLLKDDQVSVAVRTMHTMYGLPDRLLDLMAYVCKLRYPQSISRDVMLASKGEKTPYDYYKLVEEVKQFQDVVVADWKKHGLDAVICPALGSPALKLGYGGDALGTITYTAVYNLLNFPAGVVPLTRVDDEDTAKVASYPGDRDMWHRTVKKNLPGSEGLPVGLQVVTLPWQEEICLRVMKEVETGREQHLPVDKLSCHPSSQLSSEMKRVHFDSSSDSHASPDED